MNTRKFIAASVLAISASVPAVVLANAPTQQGDGTTSIQNSGNYIPPVNNSVSPTEHGDATSHLNSVENLQERATRDEVLSKAGGVNVDEGDGS